MGSSWSKNSGDRARKSRTKKNMRSADRLERDRHSDNSIFHRRADYEHIRAKALRKALDARISAPIPASLPTMPQAPAPIYHKRSADRRPPPPPPNMPRALSSVFTNPSIVPAPLNIRKKIATPSGGPSCSKHSQDVPSTGRPMFSPATSAPSPMAGPYHPPPSSSRVRSRSRDRQRQPPSSRRHGPPTARYPPSSERAPPPLSSRNILPQAQPSGHRAPPAPRRSERRRVTREEVRGRR